MREKKLFNVGDWVQGHTWDKQKIYGYIVKKDDSVDIVKVYIIDSVNADLKGRMIRVLAKDLQSAAKQAPSPSAIEQLIDMALLTKDEQWFNELIGQLDEHKESVR